MKDAVIILRIDPDLKAFLEKKAKALKIPLSEYIRRAAKQASGFKDKPLV